MKYKNISESGLIESGIGELSKIIINSHSSGTVKIFDALGRSASNRDIHLNRCDDSSFSCNK